MKRKRLTASMIALVMSVSLPMTTYAANWYLEDGSVTVNADNSGQTVTQGSGSAVPDEAPVITQRNSSAETSNTIMINASENATANVTISNVNIDTSGAAVVCEEMCTGTRYFENLVDESGETLDEQFMNLSKRYMKTNCACFTPNTGRIDDILRMVDEYQVDGVIDCSLMFCCLYDTEKLAVSEALKAKNIPVLSLETDYTDKDAEQLRTRIGAFVEMLNQ